MRKGLYSGLCSLLLLLVVAAVASAPARGDYITLPIKWSQPIGVNPTSGLIIGMDYWSDHTIERVMADDFISDGRPIVAVRWWGSYLFETTPRQPAFTGPFDISFHLSVFPPQGDQHPFSLPGALLYFRTVTAQEFFVGFDDHGDAVYRYDAYLPDPFFEQAGVEYFLDIDKPTNEFWGWHGSAPPHPILDFAAIGDTHAGAWQTWMDPQTDLAFELMTNEDGQVPEPGTLGLCMSGLLLLGLARSGRSGPANAEAAAFQLLFQRAL